MALKTVKGLKEIEKHQQAAMAKSKGGGGYFLIIGAGESRKLYFLTEPELSVGFYEHVFQDPDTGGWQFLACQEPCPLCSSGDEQLMKNSYRVAYIVMPEDEKKAYILKANTDLNDRIITRFKNRETLLSSPYIVSRTGKGIDTSWDVDSVDEKVNLPKDVLKRLEVEDPVEFVEGVLQKRLDAYFDDGESAEKQAATSPVVWDPEDGAEGGTPPFAEGASESPGEASPNQADGEPW